MPLRKPLTEMLEGELREKVLIPLFKSMGFRDVYHYHGGDQEQGKDIVMWKEGNFGERVNYAVVVKEKKVSGKATGQSTAAEVCTQVQQCFGKPYLDPVTTEEQRVRQCYVVCPHDIKKEAINAIQGILINSNLDRLTTFLHGDILLGYVEKYLPEPAIWEKLERIKRDFDEADAHYRLTSKMHGNSISLSIEPKDANAIDEHPLTFSTRLRFPDTPEGRSKRDEFQQYLKTGSEVTIPKEFIEYFNVPEFLSPYIAPLTQDNWQLTTGTLPSLQNVIIVKIEMECQDGERATLEYIPLIKVQGGSEEITLSNEGQRVPWKFRMIHNFKKAEAKVEFKLEFVGVNVKRVLEGFRFMRALAKGGLFRVEHWESGFQLWHQPIGSGVSSPPDPHWIEVLEKLLFIQQTVRVPFVIPASMNIQEIQTIYETAYKLETGRIEPGNITLRAGKELAEEILDYFETGKPFFCRLEQENEVVEILGNQVPIGPAIVTIHNGYLSKDDITVLRQTIETAAPADAMSISFKSSDERPIIVEYPNWLARDSSGKEADRDFYSLPYQG